MEVVNTSILDAPYDFAIVQCISADCAMGVTPGGREIPCLALTLRDRYPDMPDFCESYGPLVGDVLMYRGVDDRLIFNLVTKSHYYDKPTYDVMLITLGRLKRIALEAGVLTLAIPKLGSGLDKLEWTRVSTMIECLFEESPIEVVLFNPKRRMVN